MSATHPIQPFYVSIVEMPYKYYVDLYASSSKNFRSLYEDVHSTKPAYVTDKGQLRNSRSYRCLGRADGPPYALDIDALPQWNDTARVDMVTINQQSRQRVVAINTDSEYSGSTAKQKRYYVFIY